MNTSGRLGSTFLCLCQLRPSTRSMVTVTRNGNRSAIALSSTKLLERSATRNHPLLLQRANKNVGRTVRKAVNVYMPGEKIPSVNDPKNVKVVADDRLHKTPEALDIFNEVMLEATKNVKQRKFIVCEGIRLVEEAFKANLKVHKLFLQKSIKEVPERLKNFVEEYKASVHHVTQTAIKNWSSLTTPPGIVGVFLKPKAGEIGMTKKELRTGMPVTVICDNLREPGNLGSILRSAAGVGCKRVLLSKGCCDPWDEKVLRGGCGAQFRLPITMNYPLYSLVDCMEIENSGYDGRVNDTSQRDEEKPSGNSEWKGRETSSIDNKDRIDGSKVENGNGKISSSSFGTTGPSSQVESYPGRGIDGKSFALFLADSNDDMETDERKTLPVVSYTDVDYTAFENVYLVVGGETEGLSRDILQITSSIQALHPQLVKGTVARLRIPLYNEIDSLNASNAFAVIAYEMLRQFHLKQL